MYIAEVSPAAIRGRLVNLNQLAIVSGILMSYLAGWLLSGLGESSWQWMFASAFGPVGLFVIALFYVPESPRWLAKEGCDEESLDILRRGSLADLFKPGMRRLLIVGISQAILQQVTGINTFTLAAPRCLLRGMVRYHYPWRPHR